MSDYPATVTVHWPTGPVDCCEEHADKLVALGTMLGGHIAKTYAVEGATCENCKNEDKSNES